MNAIEIRNLTKSFQEFELKNLSLNIEQGYMTGLIGQNGAGKSTLIKSILAVHPINSGEIKIFNQSMHPDNITVKQQIGAVMDNGYYYTTEKLKNIKKYIASFYQHWDDAVYKKYIQRFELNEEQKLKELSTGMRAKFNIALALSHHAKLIIMDEPSSGLDPVAREELMDILSETIAEHETTVLLSTHITSDLDRTSDFLVMIHQGKIILNGNKDHLKDTHYLIKCRKELGNQIKDRFISYKETAFDIEGLTTDASILKRDSMVIQRPTIEDMMRFYAKI